MYGHLTQGDQCTLVDDKDTETPLMKLIHVCPLSVTCDALCLPVDAL